MTHSTETLETELNTGRKRLMKSCKEKGKSFKGAMPRHEVCKHSARLLFVGHPLQAYAPVAVVCGLCMLCVGCSALGGSFHPSFLHSASESNSKGKPKAL